MGPVSVFRLDAARAGPAYVFRAGVRAADPRRASWLGWLPLTLVDWAGPDIAEVGDGWLTGPADGSESRPAVPGDVITVDDAAGELLARRGCGLGAFTARCPDPPDDVRVFPLSVAASVGDDLVEHVAWVRAAREVWLESLAAARGSRTGGGRPCGAPGDSAVRRRSARALCALRKHHARLGVLLEAVGRIGVFDPESARR